MLSQQEDGSEEGLHLFGMLQGAVGDLVDVGALLAWLAVLCAVPTFGEGIETGYEVAPTLVDDRCGFEDVVVVYLELLVDVPFGREGVGHPYPWVVKAAMHRVEGDGDGAVAPFHIAGLDDIGLRDIEYGVAPTDGQQGVADGSVEISVCRRDGAGDGVEGVDDEAVGPVGGLQQVALAARAVEGVAVPGEGQHGVADDGVKAGGVVAPNGEGVVFDAVASEDGLVLERHAVAIVGEGLPSVRPGQLVLHDGVVGGEVVGGMDVDGGIQSVGDDKGGVVGVGGEDDSHRDIVIGHAVVVAARGRIGGGILVVAKIPLHSIDQEVASDGEVHRVADADVKAVGMAAGIFAVDHKVRVAYVAVGGAHGIAIADAQALAVKVGHEAVAPVVNDLMEAAADGHTCQ